MKVPDIAERAGHKRSWLYDIERGKYTPNPDDLRALAQAMGIDAGYLLSGEDAGDSEWIARLRGLEAQLDERAKRSVVALAVQQAEWLAEHDEAEVMRRLLNDPRARALYDELLQGMREEVTPESPAVPVESGRGRQRRSG